MPVYFVVYVQVVNPMGWSYYRIIKSIPTTVEHLDELWRKEIQPIQSLPQEYGGYIGYLLVYREPENPFQQKAKEEE